MEQIDSKSLLLPTIRFGDLHYKSLIWIHFTLRDFKVSAAESDQGFDYSLSWVEKAPMKKIAVQYAQWNLSCILRLETTIERGAWLRTGNTGKTYETQGDTYRCRLDYLDYGAC